MTTSFREPADAIVNFSPFTRIPGKAGDRAFVAVNAGIPGFTRWDARAVASGRICVPALAPGRVLTKGQLGALPDQAGLAGQPGAQCVKNCVKPAEVAWTTPRPRSEASRMMTGQAVLHDGGVAFPG